MVKAVRLNLQDVEKLAAIATAKGSNESRNIALWTNARLNAQISETLGEIRNLMAGKVALGQVGFEKKPPETVQIPVEVKQA